MLWSEASSVCNGRVVPVRPFQPPIYPQPIRVLDRLPYDSSCEGSHHLACLAGRQFCLQHWISYLFSGETFSAIMYYIPCTAALVISLHVFEDDTVAKVTVSKANRNVFFGFVGPCPVFCCFAVLLVSKRKSGWGICGSGRFWLRWLCCFWFSLFFVMICQFFGPHVSLYISAFHCLRNCKDCESAKPEGKKDGGGRCGRTKTTTKSYQKDGGTSKP